MLAEAFSIVRKSSAVSYTSFVPRFSSSRCSFVGARKLARPLHTGGRSLGREALNRRFLYFEKNDGNFRYPREYPVHALVSSTMHDHESSQQIRKISFLFHLPVNRRSNHLAAAWIWFILNISYSNGERVGYTQKISKKGWVCKTATRNFQ